MSIPNWHDRAACRDSDHNLFFPAHGESAKAAKEICAECPVQKECLQWAVDEGMRFGIWGGLNEKRRRHLAPSEPPEGEKRCTRCEEFKTIELFPSSSASKDGLHSHCKECRRVAARRARGATGWVVQGRLPKEVA